MIGSNNTDLNDKRTNENCQTDDVHALNDGVSNKKIQPLNDERYDHLLFYANVKPEIMKFLLSRLQQQGI